MPRTQPASTLDPAIPLGLGLAFLLQVVGCAHQNKLAGTTVTDTQTNRELLATIEQYRLRIIEKNVEGLLLLASERYFEDSGTPTAEDDYGYDGLKFVLSKGLARLKSVRYDIQYRSVRVDGSRADVEVYLSGAFELIAESGDRYRRVGDYHRFKLERDGKDKWKFLSGM
jgi:hypothetical protein